MTKGASLEKTKNFQGKSKKRSIRAIPASILSNDTSILVSSPHTSHSSSNLLPRNTGRAHSRPCSQAFDIPHYTPHTRTGGSFSIRAPPERNDLFLRLANLTVEAAATFLLLFPSGAFKNFPLLRRQWRRRRPLNAPRQSDRASRGRVQKLEICSARERGREIRLDRPLLLLQHLHTPAHRVRPVSRMTHRRRCWWWYELGLLFPFFFEYRAWPRKNILRWANASAARRCGVRGKYRLAVLRIFGLCCAAFFCSSPAR